LHQEYLLDAGFNVLIKISDMSTIISIYLFVAFSFLAFKAFVKNMPQLITFIIAAPFAPFIVAWKSRVLHPCMSLTILILWSTIIAIVAIIVATYP
jgi:hypothetical protein